VLKYGYAKAKFTANATYHQTLVVQAAQAVKAAVLKGQQHSVDAVMKEAENAVANAEVMTAVAETLVAVLVTAEADQVPVVIVRVAKVDQIARVAVPVVIVRVVETVRVAQLEEDN